MNPSRGTLRWGRALRGAAALAGLGLVTSIGVAWVCAAFVTVPGNVLGRMGMHARQYVAMEENRVVVLGEAAGLAPGAGFVPAQQTRDMRPWAGPSVYATRWDGFGSAYFATGTNVGYFPAAPGAIEMERVVPRGLRAGVTPWLDGEFAWPGTDEHRYFGARGWPLLAMWCEFRTTGVGVNGGLPWVGKPEGGIEMKWRGTTPSWYVPPPPVGTLPYRPVWSELAVDTAVYGAAWWVVVYGVGIVKREWRKKTGMCVGCGYDLRGLGAGAVCPECGRAGAA